MEDCLGCRIANGIEPGLNILFENERVTCVLDIDPFHEGHALILPKAHAVEVEELDAATALAIMEASQRLSIALKRVYAPDGITIHNGGTLNDLTHYHMHVFPRYVGDGFSWDESLRQDGAKHRLGMTRDKLLPFLSTQEE